MSDQAVFACMGWLVALRVLIGAMAVGFAWPAIKGADGKERALYGFALFVTLMLTGHSGLVLWYLYGEGAPPSVTWVGIASQAWLTIASIGCLATEVYGWYDLRERRAPVAAAFAHPLRRSTDRPVI